MVPVITIPPCHSPLCSHFLFPPLPSYILCVHMKGQWIPWAPEIRCSHHIKAFISNTFWRAVFQNNTLQTNNLVTKRTFPRWLPLHDTCANAEYKVTSGSPWLGGKLACWHWAKLSCRWIAYAFRVFWGCSACDASAKATWAPEHSPPIMLQLIAGLSRPVCS